MGKFHNLVSHNLLFKILLCVHTTLGSSLSRGDRNNGYTHTTQSCAGNHQMRSETAAAYVPTHAAPVTRHRERVHALVGRRGTQNSHWVSRGG